MSVISNILIQIKYFYPNTTQFNFWRKQTILLTQAQHYLLFQMQIVFEIKIVMSKVIPPSPLYAWLPWFVFFCDLMNDQLSLLIVCIFNDTKYIKCSVLQHIINQINSKLHIVMKCDIVIIITKQNTQLLKSSLSQASKPWMKLLQNNEPTPAPPPHMISVIWRYVL